MKYLTAAIKEALRLYPPVPFISRELDEDIEVQGYRIPAGTSRVCVWCAVREAISLTLHRNRGVHCTTGYSLQRLCLAAAAPLPARTVLGLRSFDAHRRVRFLGEAEDRNSYTYIPFSAGPRKYAATRSIS